MDWEVVLTEVRRQLGISEAHDLKAAQILDGLLVFPAHSSKISELVSGNVCFVFGAGPSLKKDVWLLREGGVLDAEGVVFIAADGAAAALLDQGFVPHLVVTDLDGGDETLLSASAAGSLLIVHAHADNVEKLQELVPHFDGPLVGTTQTRPFGNLHNFGGFTDGDRAISLCLHFGALGVVLAGMDFGSAIGEHAGNFEPFIKEKKLAIGKQLLEDLATSFPGKIRNFTCGGDELVGIPRMDLEQLRLLLEDGGK